MITSSQNPKIQQVRTLLSRSHARHETQSFVVEGVRLAEEAQLAGWQPSLVLYTEELSQRGQNIVQHFAAGGSEVEQISGRALESLSETETPQGLLAVFPIRELPLPVNLDFVLIADAVRDPGNLGTLLRTAAAAGAQAFLIPPGTVDAFSPKVVRSAMGAHFHLPILTLRWEEITGLLKNPQHGQPLKVFLAEANANEICWQANLRQPLALIVGGEAEGASPQGRALVDTGLQIPMPGKSESLNAAVAGSILMFEVVRQRNVLTTLS